jgi:hypothetical protein
MNLRRFPTLAAFPEMPSRHRRCNIWLPLFLSSSFCTSAPLPYTTLMPDRMARRLELKPSDQTGDHVIDRLGRFGLLHASAKQSL